MGIQVEFNPELALFNFSEFRQKQRLLEECIPEKILEGKVYNFLKDGLRNYYLFGEVPLIETNRNHIHSPPMASVIILSVTHFLKNGTPFTKGEYKVVEVFNDNKIHFNGLERADKK